MPEHVVHVRMVAVGFMARCGVCSRLIYWKLEWKDLHRADDLRCPVCGGGCEPDLDTLVNEIDLSTTLP